MLFKDRNKLADEYYDWAKENHVKDEAFSVISFLDAKGLLNEARPTGHWVLNEEKSAKRVEPIFYCSACHNNEAWGYGECESYCSRCGAEMLSVVEIEKGENDG